MIDIAFTAAIALFAIFTPKGLVKQINMVLAGKFAIFVGLHYMTVALGFTDGMWVDAYRFWLDLVFLWVFLHFRGYYLAFLCGAMAIFHLYTMINAVTYMEIMICFQILQLCYASWGCVDGLVDKYYPDRPRHHNHNHGH